MSIIAFLRAVLTDTFRLRRDLMKRYPDVAYES